MGIRWWRGGKFQRELQALARRLKDKLEIPGVKGNDTRSGLSVDCLCQKKPLP